MKKEKQIIPREEMLRVAGAMVRYGGSFVNSLGKSLYYADMVNQRKIKKAFPEYWKHYDEMGKSKQK